MDDKFDLELNTPIINIDLKSPEITIEIPGGARGLQGIQGPKGDTGPQGPKGDKGDSGVWVGSESPPEEYEVWIEPDGTPGTIPTKLSELEDDSTHRLVTDTEKSTWNSKTDFSGSYNDLTDKPNIPTKTSDLTNDSGFITSVPNDVYSPTETLTNKVFIDKNNLEHPIYRKVFQDITDTDIQTVTIDGQATKVIAHGISNFDRLIDGSIVYRRDIIQYNYYLYYVSNQYIEIDVDSEETATITIEYTKSS